MSVREAARLAAACSHCSAAPGEWCKQTTDGERSEYLHAVRGRAS